MTAIKQEDKKQKIKIPRNIKVVTTDSGLLEAITKTEKEPYISLDLEISNWQVNKRYQGEIRLMTVATRSEAFVIDYSKVKNKEQIKKLISGKGILGQNLKFDLNYIFREFGVMPKLVFDTMIASQVLAMGRHDIRYSLAEIAKRYLGVELDKTLQSADWSGELNEKHYLYAAGDTFVVFDIFDVLKEKLNNRGKVEASTKINPEYVRVFGINNPVIVLEMSFLPAICGMEINGIGINFDRLQKHSEALVSLKKEIEQAVTLQYKINPYADKEVGDVFVKDGISVPKTDKGHYSLKHANLEEMDHPLAELILGINKSKQDIDQAGRLMRNTDNGRVRGDYYQMTAATGRISSSEPPLQNIPHDDWWRSLFCASEGKMFVSADYPQIDLRIASVIMNDKTMKEVFNREGDIHRETAAFFTGKKPEDVTEEERKKAKAFNFGVLFGMAERAIMAYAKKNYGVTLTFEQAKEYRIKWFQKYQDIKRYADRIAQRINAKETIIAETIFGRQMYVDSYTTALSYPVQGTESDLIKLAAVFFRQELAVSKKKAWLCNIVHDEILDEAMKGDAEQVGTLLRRAMYRAANVMGLPLKEKEIEVKIRNTWGKE